MKNLIYFTIALLLVACNSNNNNLVIIFDNANGLKQGNPVIINDYQIGEVTKISLDSNFKIRAEIKLNDSVRLPKDSKFTIDSKDLFTKAIFINPGKLKTYLSKTDKILGQQIQDFQQDTLVKMITYEINNSKFVRNQDSIISELRRINFGIEKMKKK